MIGALAFVLFSVTSFVDVAKADILTVLEVFAIANFWTIIVMFVFVPIPKSKILQANTKIAFDTLLAMLQNRQGYDAIKVTEIMRSIKENICNRLPNECARISERFITLKNLVILMTRYDVSIYKDNQYFFEIYQAFNEFKNSFIVLLELISDGKDFKNVAEIFFTKKQNLSIHIQSAFESANLDNKQITHLATASYIAYELERMTKTLNDN
jgi:hypothetical protein